MFVPPDAASASAFEAAPLPPASPDQVRNYLDRIGFDGEPRVDFATLADVHRRHVETIPWEILDVFCKRPLTRDPRAAFDKIVTSGRGGWGYEMNGLLAWMLEGMGFTVTRMAAGVMREALGDGQLGNHLALLVHLDRTWLADVGLGNGLIEPIPLAAGTYRQGYAAFRLENLGGSWWRFHNQPDVMPPSFDFSTGLTDEALLEEKCRWLQTDPGSPFAGRVVMQRYYPDRLESLAGTGTTRIDGAGATAATIAGAAEFGEILRERFGLA